MDHNAHPHAETWIDRIFAARAADGHVIRRNIAWVDHEVGKDRFVKEVRARGFHLIQTADQFVVICHPGAIHVLF